MRLDHLLSKETWIITTVDDSDVEIEKTRITTKESSKTESGIEACCSVFIAREDDEKRREKERSEKREKTRGPKVQRYGGVAQLGEHLPCKQGVKGSNPFISTSLERGKRRKRRETKHYLRAHSSAG